MKKELVQQAVKCLQIQGVYLRHCSFTQASDFDPNLFLGELTMQYRVGAEEGRKVEVTTENAGGEKEKAYLFKVRVGSGLRLIDPSRVIDDDIEKGVVVTIEASFVAEYLIQEGTDPTQESLDEFAQNNAVYHVWPYWREFVQSTCARSNVPQVSLPMFMLPPKHQSATQEKSK